MRRRWGGLVGSGRAARAGVEVVLAGPRAAPSAAPGRRRRVRVRVRVRVREAGGAVAIELQGGGVAAADLGCKMTVVVLNPLSFGIIRCREDTRLSDLEDRPRRCTPAHQRLSSLH